MGMARKALVRSGLIPRKRDYKTALRTMAPYGGSTWWALTRAACDHLISVYRTQRNLRDFYASSFCPEEGLPHTIIGNSAFRHKATRGITYADWSAGGSHPALISESQLPMLTASGPIITTESYGLGEVLFARKFNDASGPLLSVIENGR